MFSPKLAKALQPKTQQPAQTERRDGAFPVVSYLLFAVILVAIPMIFQFG